MKFSLWTQYGARNSRPVFDAFAQSLKNHGYDYEENCYDADVNVIWSVLWNGRMAPNKLLFESKKPTIVLEVGGIERGVTWKLGVNGICYDKIFPADNHDNTRAVQLGLELSPWREHGEYILICCQNPKSQHWQRLPSPCEWLKSTVNTIREYSQHPIVIRPHPRAPLRCVLPKDDNVIFETPKRVQGTYDDYNLDFKDVHAVVSWSSNPGPQAVIEGVPVFVGPDSLARDVGNLDIKYIENPKMPDRQQWLNNYAHTEYTTDEIAQGVPLNNLLKSLDF